MELTILMPCLNEANTLKVCIEKALEFLTRNDISGEVLIADNGSIDNSVSIAEQSGARVIKVAKRGYGEALNAGIQLAQGQFVIMGDSDESYDFSNLRSFMAALRNGNQLVMGNRFQGGIKPDAMPFLHRYFGNPALSFVGRLFFGSGLGDFHCGLRGFHRQAILDLKLKSPGMEFASEMIIKAVLSGYKIAEVPTILYPDGRNRPPHLRTWHDGWRHLRFMLLFSPKWLFLYPGISFLVFGLIFCVLLLPGSLQVGNIFLDVHTLFYAALMSLIGLQMSYFYVLARAFAKREGLLLTNEKLSVEKKPDYQLEWSLVVGIILIMAGLLLGLNAIQVWNNAAFGKLNPSQVLRLVIPSGSLLFAGLQIVFNGFFLSMLKMDK